MLPLVPVSLMCGDVMVHVVRIYSQDRISAMRPGSILLIRTKGCMYHCRYFLSRRRYLLPLVSPSLLATSRLTVATSRLAIATCYLSSHCRYLLSPCRYLLSLCRYFLISLLLLPVSLPLFPVCLSPLFSHCRYFLSHCLYFLFDSHYFLSADPADVFFQNVPLRPLVTAVSTCTVSHERI